MNYIEKLVKKGRMQVFTSDGEKVTYGDAEETVDIRQGNTVLIDKKFIGKVKPGYIYGNFKEVDGKLIFEPEV